MKHNLIIHSNNLPSQYEEDENFNSNSQYFDDYNKLDKFYEDGDILLLTQSWNVVSQNLMNRLETQTNVREDRVKNITVLDCFEFPQAFGIHGEIKYPVLLFRKPDNSFKVLYDASSIWRYLDLD